jgi:hypothetical protein
MKASNIYQTLKSRAKASSTAKPQLPGIGSPLNLKAKNPIDPPKKSKENKVASKTVGSTYHLDKSPRNPYHFQKPTEKMVRTIKPLAQKTPPKEKLPMAKAAPTKLKKDTPKTKTPNEKKYEKYGYKKKIVKAESSYYDATKGELTKTFSDADVKKYGIKKTSTTKAKIKSPAKKTIDPPKRKKTTTVENFNYGDQFSSTVKTKQKNKKNGEVKVKQKSTSKNYDPATGKRTSKSVSRAKAKLETYDENVSSDPSEGTVKKSNIVSLKKSYKTTGSPKVKGKVTGSGSKSGAQSVTGKGLDKSLDNVNTLDVRRNLKSPAKKKSCGGRGNKI